MFDSLKPKSEFTRNVLTLMTGTTIAQAIPIASSPILTRLYTPEDFGVFALFMAITAVFGAIANGRYELAIMLPEKDEDAINIFALGFLITVALSLILLIIVLLFNDQIKGLLNNEEIGVWLYLIPLTVFFIGLFNILNYFNNRKKFYKDIAGATIIKSIILAASQLIIGFFKSGAIGLVSGKILSQIFANLRLLKNIFRNNDLRSKISKEQILRQAKRYKDFPKFSMWAVFANTLSQHIINILMPSLYNITTLGFYSLVQRVLAMPAALIGSSIGQVFFQEATREKQLTGQAIKTLRSTVQKLVIIGLPAFGILFFIVEPLFGFVFGAEWRIAGGYAQIVIPLFFIRFVSSTVAIIINVFERQKISLLINIALILSSLGSIYISSVYSFTIEKYLLIFTIIMSLNYLIFLVYYFKLSMGEAR